MEEFPQNIIEEKIFLIFQIWLVIPYILLSVVIIRNQKAEKEKTLKAIRIISATLVFGSLFFFISHVIYPLYLLRYSYCLFNSFFLWISHPNSTFYLEFPYYGLHIHGTLYSISISVTCVQPVFWAYLIGPISFYPSMPMKDKLKKFFILFFGFHLVSVICLFIESIVYINVIQDWPLIHESTISVIVQTLVKGVTFFLLSLKVFPEVKKLVFSEKPLVKD